MQNDASLWEALEEIANAQLMILSERPGFYEIALVMIALKKALENFFVLLTVSDDPGHRITGFRQATAVVMTPHVVLAERHLSTSGQRF